MKQIPIGIENFKELIDKDYYYVDKTLFISDVLKERLLFVPGHADSVKP